MSSKKQIEKVEPKEIRVAKINSKSFFAGTVIAAIIGALAVIGGAYIAKFAEDIRVSTARINQAQIESEFDAQKAAAEELRDETDNPQVKEIANKFITSTIENKQAHKESSDEFIEKLKGKDETGAEIKRKKANEKIVRQNNSFRTAFLDKQKPFECSSKINNIDGLMYIAIGDNKEDCEKLLRLIANKNIEPFEIKTFNRFQKEKPKNETLAENQSQTENNLQKEEVGF